ncbi:hypothetical protein O7606_22510 [Micromonospora sp. WMMD882]|uniref:hypothetical protein n=1 Tax=Micromonospora sp. WMMD882 TaxID=3015151 RepID=UPI00248D2833|nr:hypothetical protein [Micromonospora sp. WMMD882]WBB78937.1 hypothetical protein O7606_22510 [Micromonospora sp. WMMD882]
MKGSPMLRLRILLTASLCAAVGAIGAPTALAAPVARAAADTAPPVIADLTVTPDDVGVSGVDLVPVTVAVRLTDESGVIEAGEMDGVATPLLGLRRVEGGERNEGVELKLTSGTAKDGVWSATVHVPSTWDGRWEVGQVIAEDSARNRLEVDPRDAGTTVSLEVTGAHQPAVTMELTPDPLVGDGPLTVKGRFYDKDTGKGLPNQPIFFGHDNVCVEQPGTPNGVTAADGTFSRVYPVGDIYLRCVGILRPTNIGIVPAYIVVTSAHPRFRPTITASADRTTVQPGTKVTFTGTVKPSGLSTVELQQLKDGKWQKVTSGQLDDRSRFTLTVTPKATGEHSYRVARPSDDPELVGASKTIVVRVTTSGGDGGGDGELPITGPATLPMVGGALALIAVGTGLTLLGRRRRGADPDR